MPDGGPTAQAGDAPRSARVLVVGSLMMDLVFRVPRRPRPGETVFGSEFATYLGGKGFNQAVAARRLGAEVRMIGTIGDDDFGHRLRAALVREGIGVGGICTDAEAGTGVAAPLIEESGENSIVSVPRANMRLTAADVEAATFAETDVVLLQMEVPPETSLAAAQRARAEGARVLLNTAPAGDLPAALHTAADIVVANENEAALLTGLTVQTVEQAFAAAERLRRTTGQTAIITLGGQGAVAVGEGLREHQPAHTVAVRDTTGAGDAYCGALAVRLAETGDLREALVWANAAGALAVTVLGAEPSLPSRHALVALLRGWN